MNFVDVKHRLKSVNFEIANYERMLFFCVLEIRIEIVLLRLSCLYIAFIIDRHIGKSKKCLTYDYHLNQKANHKFILHFRNMDTQLLLKLYIRRKHQKTNKTIY